MALAALLPPAVSAWDEVVPGVWIGRVLSDAEAAEACDGVTAVLDLTAEFAEAAPVPGRPTICNMPILDLTAPTPDQLREAVAFITEHSQHGTVYVHCKIGYSRSRRGRRRLSARHQPGRHRGGGRRSTADGPALDHRPARGDGGLRRFELAVRPGQVAR